MEPPAFDTSEPAEIYPTQEVPVRSVLFALVSLVSAQARAQDVATPALTAPPAAVESTRTVEGPEGTSAAERIGKRGYLQGELGSAVFPLPGLGLAGGAFVDSDLAIEASYNRGLASVYFFSVYSEVLSLRAKKYWGNTFYTNAGLARRRIGASFDVLPVPGAGDILDVEASVTSLTADVAIGNQWQWRRFNFGVDWLGVLWPLKRLETNDDIPDVPLSDEDQRLKDKVFDKIAYSRSYQVMRLYFGSAF